MTRADDRRPDQLRPVTLHTDYLHNPAGSVLIEMGKTRVICAASVRAGVPRWMRDQGVPGGWITAEYSMLPSSTGERSDREAKRGQQGGRTMEIQRLIGRSLRAAVNLEEIGANTITLDCDVIDADGGTRCASITGAFVALKLAMRKMFMSGAMSHMPELNPIAAVSVGIVSGTPVCDLCYTEDVDAEVDMNVVMTGAGEYIEIQGTAESGSFNRAQSDALLDLAEGGIKELFKHQEDALTG